ncbi:MAG: SLBB domain-containing protein [Bacteroidetes bacterium]|nr:SLBB domain-containing protein [Bacteroidota bacterium]
MRNFFLLLLLITPFFTMAQTGNTGGANSTGGNNQNTNQNQNQNNGNPYNNNPYNSNPYNNNPYLDQNQQTNQNFFDKNQNNKNQPDKNDKNQPDKNAGDNNQTDKNANDVNTLEKNKLNFQDLNNVDNQDIMLKELYKNDPEYLKYLESTKQNTDTKIFQPGNTEDATKKVYGADFFNNNSFDLSDKAPSAPPLDYRLGPGDELIVALWNAGELQKSYTIAKDGSIFPQLVGKIYVQGMTLDAASKLIATKFKKIVPNNTSVDVQLGKSRTIRVTIVGEVRKPGTYTISAFNTALNALFKAGGITEIGTLRKIEIQRDGRTVDEIDLYKYLEKNSQNTEYYLEDNDFIRVGIFEKKVSAAGEFKRPMYYQLKEEETLYDLIQLSGGPRFNARNSMIHIKTVGNEQEKLINLDGKRFIDAQGDADLVLKDGDVVTIKPINEGLMNTVKIEGGVNYPDDYEFKDGDRLSDLLVRAGGVSSNAYLPRAYVFRGSNTLESNAIKIDISDLKKDGDIHLQSGDRVKILSQKDFEQQYQIEVLGYVRKPGKVTYYKNLKLKDALLLSGGLRLDAENGRIEISNIVDSVNNFTIETNGSNIKIVSINSNLEIDEASDNILLKPLDRVYVRRKSEFLTQEKVTILGEVAYPGEYVLVDENEKLSSLVKRCGGINKTAFAEGAKLNRSNVGPVVIDLPAAIERKNSKQDIILRDNDIIIVPPMNDIVSVRGEVQQPVNIKYDKDNTDIGYYVNSAGGYGERPWRSRVNVKYLSGRIKNTKNFLFFHFYPKVKPGSIVTVPRKPTKENRTKFSELFTYSLSAVTTLATLLVLSKSLSK